MATSGGFNWILILGILGVFIAIGTLLPFIKSEMGESSETQTVSAVGFTDILVSILSVFTFGFGTIPWWLEAFLGFLKVILALLLYDLYHLV